MITQIVILKQLLTFPKEVIYLYFLSFLPLFNNYNLLIGRVL